MEQFLIQQILHNLRLHLNSILFLILRKWQTSIRLILVTFIFLGWVIFSSVTNILSLLTLFLASCYSPKLLLTIYLVFLAFLISYLLLTQSNCVVLNLIILVYIFLLILFFVRRHTNFQERLNSF